MIATYVYMSPDTYMQYFFLRDMQWWHGMHTLNLLGKTKLSFQVVQNVHSYLQYMKVPIYLYTLSSLLLSEFLIFEDQVSM